MNTSIMAAAVAGTLVAAWLFFNYISGVGKAFKDTEKPTNSAQIRSQQEENIQEIRRKHRQLMDDMRQKISDGTRKKY